jgi:hypothetical protein
MNELVKIKNLSSREEKVSYIIQNKERFKWERNGMMVMGG